jgi:hypothetical protein
MKRAHLVVAFALLASACSGSSGNDRRATAGTGGEGDGGDGGDGGGGGSSGAGGGGRGGSGGMPAKPDAMPVERDAGTDGGSPADAAGDGGAPATADCTTTAPGTLLCNTLRPFPRTIKETGLFPNAPDFSRRPASLREYAPDPALWSDGLEKQRFLLLPQGTKIDNTDGKRWGFPIGTVFIKTFFDEGGAPGKPRPIETRFIRRVAGPDAFVEYDYAVYQWNAERTDATLVDIETKRTPVPVTVKALNGGMPFSHDIPSRDDCLACHESNGKVAQTFIGFDELRLTGKLNAAAARSQLEELAPIFTAAPPAKPAEIVDADPRLLRIKRFVFGNCVHCHNGGRVVDLRPDVLVANTVRKPIDASGVTAPPGWLRVVPSQPEMSVLYVEARRTMLPTGLKPMPPVGVALPLQSALDDLRAWITGLK